MKKIKKVSLIVALAAMVGLTSAFTYNTLTKNSATVDQQEGIFIFYKCKPAGSYDYLGSIKAPGIVGSEKPGPMLQTMIKKLKKDYSQADAIIFTDDNMQKADAVKLKE